MLYYILPQFHRQSPQTTKHYINFTVNHYKLLYTHTIPPTIIMDYWTLAQFQRRSLWTTKTQIISSIININFWTYAQIYRKSLYTTDLYNTFTDNHTQLLNMYTISPTININGKPCTWIHRFSLKTTDHNRNHANNHKLLNTQRVPLTITIKYWILPQCHRQSP